MSEIAIVTDSAASIPDEYLDSLKINWVPYYIHRGTEALRDLVTIHRDAFYRWITTADKLPTTAAPGIGDYLEMYTRLIEQNGARAIISIHMTSKGSGAYQAALGAKEMLLEKIPGFRIEVIDTLNVSMCHGWMVIESARAALAGHSFEEILQLIRKLIPVTQMVQTADTLKYLYMGGRIGRAGHLVGSLLNLKPIISMRDGVIVPLGIARSRERAYQKIADVVAHAAGALGKVKVAYVHAAALGEVDKIRKLVEARVAVVETIVAELSPALGVHTGPGTAGVCFYPVETAS